MESRTYTNGKGETFTGEVARKSFTPKIRGVVKRYANGNSSLKSFLKANLI